VARDHEQGKWRQIKGKWREIKGKWREIMSEAGGGRS
jgi:hypothetical protein